MTTSTKIQNAAKEILVKTVSNGQWSTVPQALALLQVKAALIDTNQQTINAAIRELVDNWPETFSLESMQNF